MDEVAVEAFSTANFPSGGYCIPDGVKNGAYFVQGRAHFLFLHGGAEAHEGVQDPRRQRRRQVPARSPLQTCVDVVTCAAGTMDARDLAHEMQP